MLPAAVETGKLDLCISRLVAETQYLVEQTRNLHSSGTVLNWSLQQDLCDTFSLDPSISSFKVNAYSHSTLSTLRVAPLVDDASFEAMVAQRKQELRARRLKRAENQLEAAQSSRNKRPREVSTTFADVAFARAPRLAPVVWTKPIGWAPPVPFAADSESHNRWIHIALNDVPYAQAKRHARLTGLQQRTTITSRAVALHWRNTLSATQKAARESLKRSKLLSKTVGAYIRRNDKDWRKKAEKDADFARRQVQEQAEKEKQSRKLEFLINQTEIYAHFMANKMGSGKEDGTTPQDPEAQQAAMKAIEAQSKAVASFDHSTSKFKKKTGAVVSAAALGRSFSSSGASEATPQPQMLKGTLKSYQLSGLTWMANLYSAGINGILAYRSFSVPVALFRLTPLYI